MTMKTTALEVVATLENAGFTAFLVGGGVRNELLDLPAKDWDVCTSARPEDVSVLFEDTQFVGAAFGVTLVRLDGFEYEVATYRTEGGYVDGRRPTEVELVVDVREDVTRRDFTMNALLLTSNNVVLDYVGGLEDVANRVVRCVGDPDLRFQEDALRMLRCVRFAATLGFTVEENTLAALKNNAHLLAKVSVERVRDEFNKVLLSDNPVLGMELLRDTGLLAVFLPEVLTFVGCEQGKKHHPEGDVWNHVMLMLKNLKSVAPKNLNVALACLLHDVAKPVTRTENNGKVQFLGHEKVGVAMAVDVLRRLKYDNDVVKAVASHTENHMKWGSVMVMKNATLVRFCRNLNFDELTALGKLDSMASVNKFDAFERVENFLKDNLDVVNARPLVTGDDLVAAGFKPCVEFKRTLKTTEDVFLNGRYSTKEQLLKFACALLRDLQQKGTK